MPNKRFSLSTRIFIAMIFLVVSASVLIVVITIFQYNEQAEDYHILRLERKEEAIKAAIAYELSDSKEFPIETYYLPIILDSKLSEISDIHNLDINIYDLEGKLLRTSHHRYKNDTVMDVLSSYILRELKDSQAHRVVLPKKSPDGRLYKSSYSYILDAFDVPIGIIGVPYLQYNSFQDEELKEFLFRLTLVYLFILILAIIIAYFLSKYITKSIESVSYKLRQTNFENRNEKIDLEDASSEIYGLVNSYNNMIDQLEESAVKLAQAERKHAWKEMAKQVAHEIKNPLTPMRLTVQNFAHRFNPSDPEIQQKIKDFCSSLIQEIDTMSEIASAFSRFAQMPNPKNENLNVVDEIKLALDIFQERFIHYLPEEPEVRANLDRTQLTRIITNLITNAIQAVAQKSDPKIEVRLQQNIDDIIIEVEDNGVGISNNDATRVFEPKFTTKTKGMGLGLSMVKSMVEANNGSITFVSKLDKGSIFTVTLPKN